jgi:pimeloyl-ACP methyl ester carboxylesterase
MKKWLKILLIVLIVILVIAFVGINIFARNEAIDAAHNTLEEQQERWEEEKEEGVKQSPADYDLPFEELTITNSSGMELHGWYIPSKNGASVILMHGWNEFPYEMLEEAEMLYRNGYGSLLVTVRNHNFSDGDIVSFGCDDREMEDLEAWYQVLLQKDDVDPEKIGILGHSMGGSLVLQYAAQNENLKAVVAHSPFASVKDTFLTTVIWRLDLSENLEWAAVLMADPMLFWMEQEIDCNLSEVASVDVIGEISPQPVYIMHAGDDDVVSSTSGELLLEAAKDPKEFWLCEDTGHHDCDTVYPAEFERRIIDFFNTNLLG